MFAEALAKTGAKVALLDLNFDAAKAFAEKIVADGCIAKGYGILKELRAANFIESNLFVPFSNGEQINDPVLRARWESITKK